MLMTFKVTNEDRASILRVVLDRLRKDLAGSDLPVLAADASSDPYSDRARAHLLELSTHIDHRRSDAPMTLGYRELLDGCSTPYCYLQFDDQITTNLSPGLLLAATRFLDRHEDVPVVTAVWPLEVTVDEARREVRVVTHRKKRSLLDGGETYRFGQTRKARRPVLVEEVDGYRFGLFENFYYGFYFNHIVTRPGDYSKRLGWYLETLGSTSAHEIELSARDRTFGPVWSHVAVCLDGVSILDVDYSHTDASVRPHTSTARDVHRALSAGYGIRTP